MVKKCPLAITLATAAMVLVAGPLRAESDAVSEFESENRAMIAATMALFDRAEALVPAKPHIPEIGTPVTATKIRASVSDGTAELTRMGPVDHLTGYRITWYPVDRLLGSVDFMGTWDGNKNLVCGYVTWDVSKSDAPTLEQVHTSFIDLAEIGRGTDEQIHRSLMEANCAFGAIDENFRVFDPAG